MAKRGADFDDDFEEELKKMCTETKCDICVVPISGKEAGDKHYSGKIHKKKVQKWKESWLSFKKSKVIKSEGGDDDNSMHSESNGGNDNGGYSAPVSDQDPIQGMLRQQREAVDGSNGVKVEDNGGDASEKSTEESTDDRLLALSKAPLDPKMLDSMDPSQMKKVINPKKKNRWGDDEESRAAPPEDDPLDFSFPDTYEKAMYMCFNPKTGIGYCQICNVMDRYEKKVKKHFRSAKHMGKLQTYNEQMASEAAVLSGSAEANPPPHRGFFCEVCEADCSSESQLEQHMTGDRHRTNLRLMESALAADPELDKDINPYNLPELWLRDRKHCYMCDVQLSSLRMATIHFNSRDHRRAAGLKVSEASKNGQWLNEGDLHCDVCNFRVKTEIEMRTHEAGIRHIENEKTKLAVEGAGGTWSCPKPAPIAPPRYSVQDPGVGWTGESIQMSAEMINMMDSMSGQAGFEGQAGWTPGQGPMGGHMGRNPMYPGPNGPAGGRGPPQWYHMQPQHQEPAYVNPKVIEARRYAGVDVQGLHCKCCDVRFTDKDQLEQHVELPDHMEKAKDIPHEELSFQQMNPQDYVPIPITGDSMSSVRTKQNSLHCPFCKVWFPTITILIYYHRVRCKNFCCFHVQNFVFLFTI